MSILRKITLLVASCALSSTACGSPTSSVRAANQSSAQASTPTTTTTSTTSYAPTSTSTPSTTNEATTVSLPSSQTPTKAAKLPATFSNTEDWVVRMALYFFPDLESRKNELARKAPGRLTCGTVTVDSTTSYDSPGIMWCGKSTARKFYFSEATLERLRRTDEPLGHALIMKGLAAYALNPSGEPGQFTSKQITTKAGELLREAICNNRASLEQAQGFAPGFGSDADTFLQALGSCK